MLRVRYPELTVSKIKLCMPPVPPAFSELIVGGLVEAGLPR